MRFNNSNKRPTKIQSIAYWLYVITLISGGVGIIGLFAYSLINALNEADNPLDTTAAFIGLFLLLGGIAKAQAKYFGKTFEKTVDYLTTSGLLLLVGSFPVIVIIAVISIPFWLDDVPILYKLVWYFFALVFTYHLLKFSISLLQEKFPKSQYLKRLRDLF